MSRFSRRQALTLAAAGFTAWPAAQAHAARPDSLHALAKAKGLSFGSAVGAGPAGSLTGAFEDPRYRRILVEECGLLVPENELKWYALRPDAKTYAFERADRIAAFARESGLGLRGHTLLWHHPRWMPRWADTYDYGADPRAEVRRLVVEHIQAVCARYPQIGSWDVVNETVDEKTGELRETAFSRHYGRQEIVDLAFHVAREAGPTTELVYNDYMSWEDTPEKANHRTGVLRLLEGFRKRGVPVDALGVQAHIGSGGTGESTGFAKPDLVAWRRFLDEVTGMGYRLLITEFDVNDRPLAADIPSRDAEVARLAREYLDVMLSYRQLNAILVWGMADRYSWLQNTTARTDGLPKRPTPYDDAFRPKPLRDAIAAAIKAAPAR
jgi:endo-1,4-beta-xylanase